MGSSLSFWGGMKGLQVASYLVLLMQLFPEQDAWESTVAWVLVCSRIGE